MSKQPGSSVLVTHWFPRTGAIFALAVLASACGGAGEEHPGRVNVDSAQASTSNELEKKTDSSSKRYSDSDDGDDKECEKGDAEECRITLPSQGSVKNCVEGVRYCDDGHWSECEVH